MVELSRYFRPIFSTEKTHPRDAIFFGLTPMWFNTLKVFERGKISTVINVTDAPIEVKSRLSVIGANPLDHKNNPPLVMGVLNLSPDSFSSESQVTNNNGLAEHISSMVEGGMDIIDIGGESTRPGFTTVAPEEEKIRIREALQFIRTNFPDLPISIDTRKAAVAESALALGAKMVNDVSALNFDRGTIEVVKQFDAHVSLMHSGGSGKDLHRKIEGKYFLLDIFDYLKERIDYSVSRGIARSKIIIDPGIGFGKTQEQNLAILSNISLFHTLGCPILVGVSRKKFLGTITGEVKPADRLMGSVLVAGELVKQGVQVIRVHDVNETKQVVKMLHALWKTN